MCKAGACGYLLKDCDFDELIGAIHAIAEGGAYFAAEFQNMGGAETRLLCSRKRIAEAVKVAFPVAGRASFTIGCNDPGRVEGPARDRCQVIVSVSRTRSNHSAGLPVVVQM
jgi:hypothetical protein